MNILSSVSDAALILGCGAILAIPIIMSRKTLLAKCKFDPVKKSKESAIWFRRSPGLHRKTGGRRELIKIATCATLFSSLDATQALADFSPNAILTVQNIAALRALAPAALNQQTAIFTQGYYAVGDGGGSGPFYFGASNPGSDNGGTWIHSNTSGFYFTLNHGSAVSTAQFGALPDGTTDYTARVQAALDWVGGIGGGTVVLALGTTVVTRVYLNYSNVTFNVPAGARLLQTLTGIINDRVTGQAPAYAAIHINPLTYTNNPSSPITQISNVTVKGDGIIQGPYDSNPGYEQYALGLVSNDTNNCVLGLGLRMLGFGGENVLHNPSGSAAVTGCAIRGFADVNQGGELGCNNSIDFDVSDNNVHDSWTGNGIGGNGLIGTICRNRVFDMQQGAIAFGGSGEGSPGVSSSILCSDNVTNNTGMSVNDGYAAFMTDDGDTTVVKNYVKFCNNILTNHNGAAVVASDYNSGTVDMDDNMIGHGTGMSPIACVGFAPIAGSARYNLRGNTITANDIGVEVTGGTPEVVMAAGNLVYGNTTTDIDPSAYIHQEIIHNPDLSVTSWGGMIFENNRSDPPVALTQASSITINAFLGAFQELDITANTAIALANPSNGTSGAELYVLFHNISGGTFTGSNLTFGTNFKTATFTDLTNAFYRIIHFKLYGTLWVQDSAAVDVS